MTNNIKERFLQLVELFSADPEDLEVLEMAANSCMQYVAMVVTMELRMPILQAKVATRELNGDEFRQAVEDLDKARRHHHDAAIAMLKSCCRLATLLGGEPLFDGDTSDRNAVADFCGKLVQEFFDGRAGTGSRPMGEWIDAAKRDGV